MENTILEEIMSCLSTEIGKRRTSKEIIEELSEEEYRCLEYKECTENAFILGLRLGMEICKD